MRILKTLIHPLTPTQIAELGDAKIVDLKEVAPELAAFVSNCPDNWDELNLKATELARLCQNFDAVLLPCGSPAFAFVLAEKFASFNVICRPLFAHSVRDSVEKKVQKEVFVENPDGSFRKERQEVVEKVAVFNHIRFF